MGTSKPNHKENDSSLQDQQFISDAVQGTNHSPSQSRILERLGLSTSPSSEWSLKAVSQGLLPEATTHRAAAQAVQKDTACPGTLDYTYIVVRLITIAIFDKEWQTQVAALQALSRLGHPGRPTLMNGLEFCLSDSHEQVRALAAQAMGEIGARGVSGEQLYTAISALCKAASDPAWQVRAAAIQAMGKLGGPYFINYVVFALDDEDGFVRVEAVHALNHLEKELAHPRLNIVAQRDGEPLVQDAAQSVLQSPEQLFPQPVSPIQFSGESEQAPQHLKDPVSEITTATKEPSHTPYAAPLQADLAESPDLEDCQHLEDCSHQPDHNHSPWLWIWAKLSQGGCQYKLLIVLVGLLAIIIVKCIAFSSATLRSL